VTVAQLINSLPRAFFNSPPRKIDFIALSSGEHDVRRGSDLRQRGRRRAAQFPGQRLGRRAVRVENRADFPPAFLEAPRHVGTHAADPDKSDLLSHGCGTITQEAGDSKREKFLLY
jgi:hypothetical protein